MGGTAEMRTTAGHVSAAAEVRTTSAAKVATATRVHTTAMLCKKGSRESRGRQN